MTNVTIEKLKHIKELISAVTGFEDDDQQYVDDARDAAQKLIEEQQALAAQRQFFGLTDEDKEFIELTGGKSDVLLAELVEAKLREKNT
jgi:hypothetical protein